MLGIVDCCTDDDDNGGVVAVVGFVRGVGNNQYTSTNDDRVLLSLLRHIFRE